MEIINFKTKYLLLRYLIIFFLLFAFNCLHSQNWEITFNSFNKVEGWDVIETYDKGYIFVGLQFDYFNYNTILIKTDINGKILWNKVIGINSDNDLLSINQTNDGGLILGGSTTDTNNVQNADANPCILKLNCCGEHQWAVIYDVKNYNTVRQVKYLQDNTYALMCYCLADRHNETSTILRTDSIGNISWLETAELSGVNFIITKDSSYLITGNCYKPIPGNDSNTVYVRSIIEKVSSNGSQIFYKPFGVYENLYTIGTKSIELINGEFLTIGAIWNLRHDDIPVKYLIKSDKYGNPIWYKSLGDTSQTPAWVSSISVNDTNSIVLASYHNNSRPYTDSIQLQLINNDGKIIKNKVYSGGISSRGCSIKETFDNKFIICATKNDVSGSQNMAAIKIKPNLELDNFTAIKYNYDTLCHKQHNNSTVDLSKARIITINPDTIITVLNYVSNKIEFILYPNPCKNQIMLKFKIKNKLTNYLIYDLMGNIVKQGELNNHDLECIDISNLPSGTFFLRVISENNYNVVKLFKQ